LLQKIEGVPPLGPETGSSDTIILNRLRMLAAVDEGVGQLLKTLDESGQLDNTLFVVTSDHGYFYGEHGLSVERRLAYEEAIRIPMLMRYPAAIQAGTTIDPMVITLDLAPTLIELAGGQVPAHCQGRSVWPLIEGKRPDDWRKSFLIEYYSDTVFPRMHKMGYKAVRGERWKYIRFEEQKGADELYDLEADPYELKNVLNDPAAKPALQQMQAELSRLLGQPPSS
jgi:N-acetylglucosamine-6-sulfatase